MQGARKERLLAAAVAVIILQGCAGKSLYERPLRPAHADDVATVTVSVPSVSRWEDVAAQLQPQFKMDSDTALSRVLPVTQVLDQQFEDALNAGLGLSLPTTRVEQVTKEELDADSDTLETTSDTRTTTSNRGSAATLPADAAASLLARAQLGALGGMDPMLQYLAAAALQQEVQLLNRYIKDLVRSPDDQVFVVRVPVSVLARGRSMPFDIETDLTIHAEDLRARAEMSGPGAAALVRGLAGEPRPRPTCSNGGRDMINVLPMLVTDNLETLQAGRSTDAVRRLALALAGTAGGVGASGQLGRTLRRLEQTAGREVNSLFSVGKLSDDTVRVRLGAVQNPRYGYVTTTRNHNVSLVVILRPCVNPENGETDVGPAKIRPMTLVSRTSFRDAETGKLLPYQDGVVRARDALNRLSFRWPGELDPSTIAKLYQSVHAQDRDAFFTTYMNHDGINRWCIQNGSRLQLTPDGCFAFRRAWMQNVAGGLWTDLHSIRLTGEFAWTPFQVALRKTNPIAPVAGQTALVTYTDAEGTVRLSQGRDLSSLSGIQVTLVSGGTRIAASEVAVDASGTAITARFPGLGRYKPGETDNSIEVTFPTKNEEACSVVLSGVAGCTITYPARLSSGASATAPAGYALEASATAVMADAAGDGRLNIIVRRTNKEPFGSGLTLTVSGGDVRGTETVRGMTLTGEATGWRVGSAGEAALLLRNLVPNSVVTVTLKDGDTQVATLSRPILLRPNTRQDRD